MDLINTEFRSFLKGLKTKKKVTVTLLVVMLTPSMAMAETGDWVVRMRAVNVSPNEDSKLGKTVNNLLGAPVMTPVEKNGHFFIV